jgi:hypothetical protein
MYSPFAAGLDPGNVPVGAAIDAVPAIRSNISESRFTGERFRDSKASSTVVEVLTPVSIASGATIGGLRSTGAPGQGANNNPTYIGRESLGGNDNHYLPRQ